MILQFDRNRPRAERSSLSAIESEVLALLRAARDPESILLAARYAVEIQRSTGVSMMINKLHKGPRRTFWASLPAGSGYENFRGRRTFESAEEVLCEALAQLEGLDESADLQVLAEPWGGGDRRFSCYVQRGRYRLSVNGMPEWMQADWAALAAKDGEAEEEGGAL